VAALALLLSAFTSSVVASASGASAVTNCVTAPNPITCENALPGTPDDTWDITGAGDTTIQGFATNISVNNGDTESFKILTNASAYTISIYRLGYYGGDGARLEATLTPSVPLPQTQPNCLTDPATYLYDCGDWGVSASWVVPATAVSGIYIATLTRTDTGGKSQIPFIVRNDSSHADIVFQTSDPTWEAYNTYGGSDFYTGGGSIGRAYKVSYNRPIITRGDNEGQNSLFSNEYPAIRFLEQNGYNVTYISGVDTDRYGATLLTNHKVFMSVGHDEYWSAAQRTNVTNARNAGVNLMFLSGNEVYWCTRYEPSIDGSNTAYRTLVSYKETWADTPIDPLEPAVSTSTWRDPRFGSGALPENGLTGTMYMSNSGGYTIQVPYPYSQDRTWRNTTIASLQPGQTGSLAPEDLGYEFDADMDNGSRPGGEIDLSSTTEQVGQKMIDYGSTTAPGTVTHSVTLYKAASGALVFGAGTVQWAWGLDSDHDGAFYPTDNNTRQVTLNVLADMGAQPATIAAPLVLASPTTDTTPPTVVLTTPTASSSITVGVPVTISGTASDVGGVVAGVEVSTDGGATWHPATGTTSWSYQWTPTVSGSPTVEARATDDSVNTSAPVSVHVTVLARGCPCSIWSPSTVPPVQPSPLSSVGETSPTLAASYPDNSSVELGVKFQASVSGYVTGIRFWKGSTANGGTHTGSLWSSSGTLLATATFTNETSSGWQQVSFSSPVAVSAGTTYVASYHAPLGNYTPTPFYFQTSATTLEPLTAPSNASSGGTGTYAYGSSTLFPSNVEAGAVNYWVDVVFTTGSGPSVSSTVPASSATSVSLTAPITATFNQAVVSSSVAFTVKSSLGTSVPGTVSYNSSTNTASFTPTTPLSGTTVYTATVSATSSSSGQAMSPAYSWSFTSTSGPTQCPCSIWPTGVPTVSDTSDSSAVELGLKFQPTQNGTVTGVRFYKGTGNTGTHTGSLWTAAGALLATATFTNETATGWQTVSFSSPVAVTAGTTYIVSYHAPNGNYAGDASYFASAGVTNGPLTALSNAAAGGNGVYIYGAGGVAPTQTYNSTNYWVDVVFSTSTSAPPTVSSVTPTSGATGVVTSSAATATFGAPVTSVVFSLSSSGGSVAGTTSYNSSTNTATFTPSAALTAGVTYTASVSATSVSSGQAMAAPYTWSFTTAAAGGGGCPCSIWPTGVPTVSAASDSSAVELGLRFQSTQSGSITGVRFYKGTGNTGTHTGSLWTAAGALLATATFTNETATGWQTVSFSSPVAVTAGTTYIVSYHAPSGHYAGDASYFASAGVTNGPLTALSNAAAGGNGVYVYGAGGVAPTQTYNSTNYWVDVVFSTTVTPTPPTVSSVTPTSGSTGVATSTAATATFNTPVTSVSFSLSSSGGSVAGTTSYNSSTNTETFTPSAALTAGTTYTASVSATSVSSGLAMTSPYTWSFTTAAVAGSCPCSIWPTAVPTVTAANDSPAVELGLRFQTTQSGKIYGVRFYKGTGNTGTHTGSLWSAAGALLATATFTNETATGWQTVSFASPVAVTAGTTYIVSYHAPSGHYAADASYFASAGVTTGPLTALSNAAAGGNGVYVYGAGGVAPTQTYNSTNYWVDVVFNTS
jgi:N,N-dimethylformamidase beta subunit-like protein/uncharacterized protein DUF4082/Big-like domain-containing protein